MNNSENYKKGFNDGVESMKEWRMALQLLTPGGSEFTEPHECKEFIEKRLDEIKRLHKELRLYKYPSSI